MLGVHFEIVSADADETSAEHDPAALVRELAVRKGAAAQKLLQNRGEWDEKTLILAADTVVAAHGQILGKPQNDADAARMLRLLSGTRHEVVSGIALFCGGRRVSEAVATGVRFAPLSEADIRWYVATGEPRDKAGAYAVQGLAAPFIEGLEGDYYNVVGLPVERLDALLVSFVGKHLREL